MAADKAVIPIMIIRLFYSLRICPETFINFFGRNPLIFIRSKRDTRTTYDNILVEGAGKNKTLLMRSPGNDNSVLVRHSPGRIVISTSPGSPVLLQEIVIKQRAAAEINRPKTKWDFIRKRIV